MSTITTPAPEIISVSGESTPTSAVASTGLISTYLVLTKARLSALVLLTAAVGFVLASGATIDWITMLWTVIGTALAAGSASSLNQFMEVNRDRLMRRTRNRPLPSGTITLAHSFIAAIAMGVIGVAMLAMLVNVIAASLALLTIVLYVIAYTPLKVRTTLNTLVGAVCGAIPPMIGWVAATGTIDRGAWVLAAILFVWQIPHFLALAWLYREDYRRGGFAMLPAIDISGQLTCRVIVLTAAVMLPLGLLATLLQIAGYWYAIGSLAVGVWMLALCLRMYFNRNNANARGVFLASIVYLPVIMCLMVLDRGAVL